MIKLIKSATHQAYLISEKDIKEIIYALEICDIKKAGNVAFELKSGLAEAEVEGYSKGQ